MQSELLSIILKSQPRSHTKKQHGGLGRISVCGLVCVGECVWMGIGLCECGWMWVGVGVDVWV